MCCQTRDTNTRSIQNSIMSGNLPHISYRRYKCHHGKVWSHDESYSDNETSLLVRCTLHTRIPLRILPGSPLLEPSVWDLVALRKAKVLQIMVALAVLNTTGWLSEHIPVPAEIFKRSEPWCSECWLVPMDVKMNWCDSIFAAHFCQRLNAPGTYLLLLLYTLGQSACYSNTLKINLHARSVFKYLLFFQFRL